jgi:2-methylcitrate dehydratase PrpD
MRHEAVMTKAMHAAHAALMGLWQARLAVHGFTGPRLILEGEQGFFAGLARAPRHHVPDGPGWAMFEVSFKPHAACRHAHPAIDAALALRARGVPAEAIEVRAYADAVTFCDRPEPRNVAEAKFSLQHAVAVAFVRGTAGLEDFTESAIHDPAVAAVRAGVGVVEDPALTARYPAHFGAVVTAAGETEMRVDALGDPEVPMDDEAVAAKARELLAHGGCKRRARERLIERVLTDGDDADTPAWLVRKMRRL